MKQSGGYILVSSALGLGTMFSIYLPQVDAPLDAHQGPAAAAPAGGTEVVLLVEDQEEVRTLTHKLLQARGYHVLVAAGGAEALRLTQQQAKPINLLVTDVVMPGMTGRELSRRLARTQPGMRVLFISGYPDDSILHDGALDAGVAFLPKPFSARELGLKIREVLDAPLRAHAPSQPRYPSCLV